MSMRENVVLSDTSPIIKVVLFMLLLVLVMVVLVVMAQVCLFAGIWGFCLTLDQLTGIPQRLTTPTIGSSSSMQSRGVLNTLCRPLEIPTAIWAAAGLFATRGN